MTDITQPTDGASTSQPGGEEAPATDKPTLIADGGQPPGGEKPAEPKADETPITYDFKVPDGANVNKESLAAFTEFAKAEKLPADMAQKILDFAVKDRQTLAESWVAQQKATVEGWQDEVIADKELGGDNYAKTIATGRKAFDLIPDVARKNADGSARPSERAELKTLLEQSGLFAHPSMVRLFHAVGKALSEDTTVPGNTKPLASFYDNPTSRTN